MSDWETKIAAIINDTKKENVTSFAGVPWMLVLMNKMLEETGKENLLEIWLEVYFHGGVNFEPEQYQKILPKKILNITKYTMHPKVFLPFRTSIIPAIYC
jgi:hypothetical protein